MPGSVTIRHTPTTDLAVDDIGLSDRRRRVWRRNVIVFSTARRFGQRYLDLLAAGDDPATARATVTVEYLAELRRAYEATFDEPFPAGASSSIDQTANLAMRALHAEVRDGRYEPDEDVMQTVRALYANAQ